MSELLYREETHRLIGFCMEIHGELGQGPDEVIYKDALVVELSRVNIPFTREKPYQVRYKKRDPAARIPGGFRDLGQNSV